MTALAPGRATSGPAGRDTVRWVGGRTAERPAFGALLREWRQRRRVSQLDLAIAADVSARHVSFLETGRSRPSREMVLRLAERLDVPLRDRNPLLLAAGFAPSYPRRALDDPAMTPVREAVGGDPGRVRAVPGAGGRPRLEPGRGQRRRRTAHRGGGRRTCASRR